MALQDLLDITEKSFKKKNKESETVFRLAKDEKPPNGLLIKNPMLEFILDRRVLSYGRFYLAYGKKGSAKTTFFYDLAKQFQSVNGDVIWLETENAADTKYAEHQGVDLSRLALIHPKSIEEALNLAETFIRNMPKAYPDGQTPVLICLDSIAGSVSEYELDQKNDISDTVPGTHARLLSRWYREMEDPLANERCVFLALNQEKEKIGGMPSFSPDGQPSMMGGNAPLFSSTYQFKMAFKGDLTVPNEHGVERKVGSKHSITCKRNKLGREGNTQTIEVDNFINGGLDWWGSLVNELGKNYPKLVTKSGGWYYWVPENTEVILNAGQPNEEKGIIKTDLNLRKEDLASLLRNSPQACDLIREAFEIPPLPGEEIVKEVEKERLSKRKKKTTLADEPAATSAKLSSA